MPLAERLGTGPVWIVDMAASLSQVGCMTLDDDVAQAGLSGAGMTPDDRQMYEGHAAAAEGLLARIPRLDAVAALVGAQFKGELPSSVLAARSLEPVLAQAFFTACRFAERSAQTDDAAALADLSGRLDGAVYAALEGVVGGLGRREMRPVTCSVEELLTGMVAREDIVTTTGVLLVSTGHEITELMLQRLRNFHRKAGVVEPLEMLATFG